MRPDAQQQPPGQDRVGRDRFAQRQASCQGALGVIAKRAWQAKDRHHGVADELLQRPAMIGNDAAGMRVVAAHQGAHILRIEALAKGGGAGHVGEQNGNELSLFWHERTSTANKAGKTNLRLDDGWKLFVCQYDGSEHHCQVRCAWWCKSQD